MSVEVELNAETQALIARAQEQWNAMQGTSKQKRKSADTVRRRWTLFNRFVDEGMAGLERADVVVWVALFRHAGADGAAMVARARLAAITGLAPNTVKAALQRLAAAGWLERIRRGGPSGGVALYRVKLGEEIGQ